MMSNEHELEVYVNRLFANHRKTRETLELKQEILSNLEAKVADEMAHGMDRQAAIRLAIDGIEGIDDLLDDNPRMYVTRYRYELLQSALIYILLAWILTLPARIMPSGVMINSLLLCLAALAGIMFLVVSSHLKRDDTQTAVVHSAGRSHWPKTAWAIWGIFMVVVTAYTFILHFGSDIWFGRPLKVDGPYSLYVLAMQLALPLTSVIVPMLVHRASRLTDKHEVKEA
ncbi:MULTISPECIES: permease prefix domain 1-containing protein [Paenibacillus]|jgi:hypothetical protein|uniref:DUF1129 domain-containing protein n=1 Tax=Paenibacillus lactis TaxID=228574 RepID=A0ABS4F5Q3_9BACL|nr:MULTISPECIES: permease prefix domain 1-containing protein [Paenibacillus]MBP1891589.1 hypothetical protein [Paenibacillus lactis]MCM3494052.1 permease prefix domain 1-containing protein [Paenibacillus lactis]